MSEGCHLHWISPGQGAYLHALSYGTLRVWGRRDSMGGLRGDSGLRNPPDSPVTSSTWAWGPAQLGLIGKASAECRLGPLVMRRSRSSGAGVLRSGPQRDPCRECRPQRGCENASVGLRLTIAIDAESVRSGESLSGRPWITNSGSEPIHARTLRTVFGGVALPGGDRLLG